ncbi:MAG: hypothetical protein IJ109_07365 [Firmicutes bacterium]|nr:hypothetical protein [Bacillota bacterium]
MKKMKWLLAAVLSLSMVFAMGSTVFADENDEGEAEVFVDNETTLEDGEYSAEDYTFTLLKKSDGSVATALSLEKVIVTDAEAMGVFKVDKNTKTHLYTGELDSSDDVPSLVDETGNCGEGVYAVDTEDTLTAVVPVDINGEESIAVRTYMKSSYKWVNYSYLIEMDEPDWKPTQNQEKSEKVISSMGMVSLAEQGTELYVNEDGTITVEVTTKPMTSNRYSKFAVSLTQFELKDAEQYAEGIDVTVGTAKDNYTYKGEDYGQIPYYWSMFEFNVPIEQIGVPIHIGVYNDLKKVNDDTKEYVIDEASASWQRILTWTITNTPELIEDIRDIAADTEDQELASRMIAEADLLEVQAVLEEAKADPTNKEKVQKALDAIAKMTDTQKEALAEDIAAVNTAKEAIDLEDAKTAIAAAKADATNKDKVQAALDAIAKLTDAQKEELAADITEVNTAKEQIEIYEAAQTAIAAAKADPTNKDKVQAALAAIAKLTDAQKADETLAADIKTVSDAKTAIDKKDAQARTNAEISKIKASTITLKKAKAGKKKVTVTWKKDANVAGYEISYKVAGAKAKTVKITKNSTTKKVIKKLKKGKKCTVKIRGFKKINNQMVYTKWSKAKTVKVK